MAFKPNDHGHGHIHGIVHNNAPILGTKVHLSMPNNSEKKEFLRFCYMKCILLPMKNTQQRPLCRLVLCRAGALDKSFAVWFLTFAEYPGHSANCSNPVAIIKMST